MRGSFEALFNGPDPVIVDVIVPYVIGALDRTEGCRKDVLHDG